MKKIYFVSSRLHNEELTNLLIDTVGIIKKYDPDKIGVKPFYDILLEQQALLKLITNFESTHPLSPTINMQRKQLSNLAISLKNHINNLEKSNLKVMQDNLLIVKPIVVKYFKTINAKNVKSLEGKVKDFLDAYQESDIIKQAGTSLNVGSFVDELSLIYPQLKLNTEKRDSDRAIDTDLRKDNAANGVLNALKNLIKAIELASIPVSSFEYEPLIAELNKMFSNYNALSRSRITKSNNASIKNELKDATESEDSNASDNSKNSADTSSTTTSAEI